MKNLSMSAFRSLLFSQCVEPEHYAFECPNCARIQSAHDFVRLGLAVNIYEAEPYVGFTCINRLLPAAQQPPGPRCEFTLGINGHSKAVHIAMGNNRPHHWRFLPATRKAALLHRHENLNRQMPVAA